MRRLASFVSFAAVGVAVIFGLGGMVGLSVSAQNYVSLPFEQLPEEGALFMQRVSCSRAVPTINGRVEGSLCVANWSLGQVLALPESATITHDLVTPNRVSIDGFGSGGWFDVVELPWMSFGGGHLSLQGGSVGRVVCGGRYDVNAVPVIGAGAPSGSQSVTISSPMAPNWPVVRNVTITGGAGAVVMPAGAYGTVSVSGMGNSLVLDGGGGGYSFQSLSVSNGAQLVVSAPTDVCLSPSGAFSINSNAVVGNEGKPRWLRFHRGPSGGGTIMVTGQARVFAELFAPNSVLSMQSGGEWTGYVTISRLNMQGNNCVLRALRLEEDRNAPAVTGPSWGSGSGLRAITQSIAAAPYQWVQIPFMGISSSGKPLRWRVLSGALWDPNGWQYVSEGELVEGFYESEPYNFQAAWVSQFWTLVDPYYNPEASSLVWGGGMPWSIQYVVYDEDGNVSEPAWIYINVATVPIAYDQWLETNQDTPLGITLYVDDPMFGGSLNYEIWQQPSHGTLSGGGGAYWTYTPDPGWSGTDTFMWSANSPYTGTSNMATVTITVKRANQPPVVTLTSPVNGATFVRPAGVTLTAAPSDPDGVNDIVRVEFYSGGSGGSGGTGGGGGRAGRCWAP